MNTKERIRGSGDCACIVLYPNLGGSFMTMESQNWLTEISTPPRSPFSFTIKK